MKELCYRKEMQITKEYLNDITIPKVVIEKEFIIKFLNEIPLDKLKKLVNFKEIDYENQELCNEAIDDYNYSLQEKILRLKSFKAIEFIASATL